MKRHIVIIRCTCTRPIIGAIIEDDDPTCGRCNGQIVARPTPRLKARRTWQEMQDAKARKAA